MGLFRTLVSPIRFSWNFARDNLNPIGYVRDSVSRVVDDNLTPREHLLDNDGEIQDFEPSDVFEQNVIHFNLSKKDLKHREKQFYRTALFNSVLTVLSSGLITYFAIDSNWFALILAVSAGFIWAMIALHNYYRAWQIRERKLEKFIIFLNNPEYWFR